MDLFANLTANTLTVSLAALTKLATMVGHQGDRYTLSLWLATETGLATAPLAVAALPAEFDSIALGARSKDNLEEADLLFSVTDWAEVGTGDTLHYEAEINFGTTSIAAKFPEANVTKRFQDALLDIELLNSGDPTLRRTIVSQWPVRIDRDINRGTEGVPVDGDPAYPLPGAIALKAPTDGGYRIDGVNLQLWNSTQGIYQTIYLTGASGAEALTIG